MSFRLSCLFLIFCSSFIFSHASTKIDCKSVLQNGCVFKRDSNGEVILDCGYKVLSETPKIDQGCSTPKTV